VVPGLATRPFYRLPPERFSERTAARDARDSAEFPVEISLRPLQTEEGWLIISAIRDITEETRPGHRASRLNASLKQRVAERTA